MRAAVLCSALLTLAWAGPARAADAATDAMQAAYAPYRAALVRTSGQAVVESAQALAQAQKAWAGVVARFGTQPPAPYDRDSGFAAARTALGQLKPAYGKLFLKFG